MSVVPEPLKEALQGRYCIERELGRGGMATVYLATDARHHRPVAIKVLSPDLASEIGSDRFLREIETAARLTHPHILPLHDSGAAGELLYYVMPYVEGDSLRHRLDREKQLAIEDALRLTAEIASALGYAHLQGVIHRDVKPENVLLAHGIALVADFGIARAVGSASLTPATRTGVTLGTPRYMAPEQAAGSGELDGRADLYSLGCMLYEMLAGQPPFTGPSAESIIHQHLSVEPRPVTDLRPSVPQGVAAALAKALAKTPADRYPTAARFAEALAVGSVGGPALTPTPAASEAAVPNNLPKPRTRFIGREKELAECERLLSESRILTLTGIGGCGKTRIALELAARRLGSHPDGVWFVDLAPVSDEDRVAPAVAAALGVRERPGVAMVETLARQLAGKCALIVLDNCEHLIAATAALVERLLASDADLRLIATSRESLGVEGERPYNVRSFRVPADATRDRGAIEASEAVRLFVDRARVVVQEFTLGAETAPVVAEICRRLDGIPLAIELAAARVEMLSLEWIRDRLEDRFRLLTGGRRATPRHQTLRAAMQWSYGLLAPESQRLFRLLSVFAGGWTLPAAAAIVGEEELTALERLTDLVHKSLVQVEREEGSEPRYRMLETVRLYAVEHLNESGEGDQARARHVEFFLAFAEEAAPKLRGPELPVWLRRMDREEENLLAAHAWCDRMEGGGEKGLELIAAWDAYWIDRGRLELGLRVFREALGRSGATGSARAGALYRAGFLALQRRLPAEARAYAKESLSMSRGLGEKGQIASALELLGMVATREGDFEAGRAYQAEAVALVRVMGNRRRLSIALNNLGVANQTLGELEAARALYEEALHLSREEGEIRVICLELMNLAQIEITSGDLESGRMRIRECLARMEPVGSRHLASGLAEVATGLAAASGDFELAARLCGAADSMHERMDKQREAAEALFLEPFLAQSRRGLGEGGYAAAYASGHALAADDALTEIRSWLRATDGGGAP